MEFLISIIGVLGGLAVLALLITYTSLSWGIVCYNLYHWFMMPVFANLPAINLLQAIGIMFFIALFRNNRKGGKTDKQWWIGFFINPWLTLLIAYLFKIIFYL